MAEWKDTPKFFYPKSLVNSSVWMAESGKSWQEEFWRKKDDKVGFFRPVPGSWQDIKSGNTYTYVACRTRCGRGFRNGERVLAPPAQR